MGRGRVILKEERFKLTLLRLCHQLLEAHENFEDSCIIGIQPRGILLSDRIYKTIQQILGHPILHGRLDITFFRDDFRTREKPMVAHDTEMEFLVEDKHVVLVDDVLYTGRTIQAAMTAIQQFGRPASIELLTLVDRRFNRHLPVKADYVGIRVDALDEAYVKVTWSEKGEKDGVLIFPQKVS